MALLERAQRQNGLCPCEAPPLAFALHAVLDHGTAGRLHHPGPDGQARGQVRIILHPAPVVVQECDDLGECLPHRLPELLLRQDLSQATDDISDSTSENLRQLHKGGKEIVFPGRGFYCTQRVPSLEPSWNKALAAVQR